MTVAAPTTRALTLTAGGQAQFRFPYDEPLIAELKVAVDGVTWNGSLRAWTVRARAANIRAIAEFARTHHFAGVAQADATRETLFAAAQRQILASRAAAPAAFTLPPTVCGDVLPYQLAAIEYAVRVKRCLLADEPGLGKTIEAIGTLETLQAFPAVVVCPASLKFNWLAELNAWLPHRQVSVIDAGACSATVGQPDVVILNYDILADHVDALRTLPLQAVVFDEAHLLKEGRTQRSRAARKLRRRVPVRLMLTGTPVLNSPRELLNPLTTLGTLDDMGGFWHFVKRYCAGEEVEREVRGGITRTGWEMDGAANLPELAARLRAVCMVRRRKRDVLPELPPRRLAFLPVEIDTRAEYDAAQRDVLAWIARRAGRDAEFRASIAHLERDAQIAAVLARAQAAADRAGQARELVRLEALRQISARGKVNAAEEWITNFLATGQKLVVFAWHQEVLDTLAARLAAPVIHGQTPTAERQRLVTAFQRDRAMPLLLLNEQAGGVGLTLTAASNVLVLEYPWTPALLDQAIDRVHRYGQRAAVTAWLMAGRRTIDFPIWQMLQKKRSITTAATR